MNAALDRFPRQTAVIGGRQFSLFRVFGVLGFVVATGVHLLAGVRVGLDPMTVIGAGTAVGLSLPTWAWLRRLLTGEERLVLFEHVWAALGAAALYGWAVDVSVPVMLDVTTAAVAVFLAGGRLGCLAVGCCHGGPSSIGVWYAEATNLSPRLRAQRLFPVQLFESAALAAIGLVGLFIATARPGTATVWFLVMYALVRLVAEQARGDVRPTLGPFPIAVLAATVQLGAAIVLAERWLAAPEATTRTTAVAAMLCTIGVVAVLVLATPRRSRLEHHHHLDEIWSMSQRLVASPAGEPSTDVTSEGVVVAASVHSGHLHVSLSHHDHNVLGVGRSLDSHAFERNGIVHLTMGYASDNRGVPAPADPAEIAERPVPTAEVLSAVAPTRVHAMATNGSRPAGYFGDGSNDTV